MCTLADLACLFFVKHFPFLNDFEFNLNLTMLSPSNRIKKENSHKPRLPKIGKRNSTITIEYEAMVDEISKTDVRLTELTSNISVLSNTNYLKIIYFSKESMISKVPQYLLK